MAIDPSLSIAVTGSGGSGGVTAGIILLESIAKAGLYGLMSRSVGPQIRGGESAAMVRFSSRPANCLDDRFDLLVGLDWLNVSRFADEIPLDSHSLIVSDPLTGDIPEALTVSNVRVLNLPVKELASSVDGGRANMVALGIVGSLSGLSLEAITESTRQILSSKKVWYQHALINRLQSLLLLAVMGGFLALLGWLLWGSVGIFWLLLVGFVLLLFNPVASPAFAVAGVANAHKGFK